MIFFSFKPKQTRKSDLNHGKEASVEFRCVNEIIQVFLNKSIGLYVVVVAALSSSPNA